MTGGFFSVFRKLAHAKSIEDVIQTIHIYRQIHLLCSSYNRIHRLTLLPIAIVGSILCFAAPVYIILSKFEQLHFSAVTIFGNLFNISVIIICICFYFPSTLHQMSKRTLHTFKRMSCRVISVTNNVNRGTSSAFSRAQHKRYRVLRKYCLSLAPVKIQFLHSNYFDRLTSLVFFKYSTRLAIHFTLIDKE